MISRFSRGIGKNIITLWTGNTVPSVHLSPSKLAGGTINEMAIRFKLNTAKFLSPLSTLPITFEQSMAGLLDSQARTAVVLTGKGPNAGYEAGVFSIAENKFVGMVTIPSEGGNIGMPFGVALTDDGRCLAVFGNDSKTLRVYDAQSLSRHTADGCLRV